MKGDAIQIAGRPPVRDLYGRGRFPTKAEHIGHSLQRGPGSRFPAGPQMQKVDEVVAVEAAQVVIAGRFQPGNP